MHLAGLQDNEVIEEQRILSRHNHIPLADFSFNFNAFGDRDCVLFFRFRKRYVLRMVAAIAWPTEKRHTARNCYAVTTIWQLVLFYDVFPPHAVGWIWRSFSEKDSLTSRRYIGRLLNRCGRHIIVLLVLFPGVLQPRTAMYAEAIHNKGIALPNCIGFIDGTFIGIARPKGHKRQRVVYNGHKCKHALKYQAVNTPDGLILHAAGPIEGRRHDWTLYVRSSLDEVLPGVLNFDGLRYPSPKGQFRTTLAPQPLHSRDIPVTNSELTIGESTPLDIFWWGFAPN